MIKVLNSFIALDIESWVLGVCWAAVMQLYDEIYKWVCWILDVKRCVKFEIFPFWFFSSILTDFRILCSFCMMLCEHYHTIFICCEEATLWCTFQLNGHHSYTPRLLTVIVKCMTICLTWVVLGSHMTIF